MSVKIVTDTTACVDREFAAAHDITIVPLKVRFSDDEREEGMPGEYGWFYSKLENTKEFPKTSLPAPETFREIFARIRGGGDEVFCITIGSALSGTYNSACLAAEGFEKVSVVDSGSACQGIFLLIEEALDMAAAGKSAAEIAEKINSIKNNVAVAFVPDSMEYLKRGGRIGLLTASIATMLKIKPQLVFSKNKLVNVRKSIGMRNAIKELVASVPKAAVKKVFALRIGMNALYSNLKELLENAFPSIREGELSPVMGAHVGPGAIGVAYITE